MTALRIAVLGGYGLIGAAVMRQLQQAGHQVTGIGRSLATARRVLPNADWRIADLARVDVAGWADLLRDIDVVVNAAGALQDGGADDLQAIHIDMMASLISAHEGRALRVVQISAAGAHPGATTRFLGSKAEGDALLAASPLDHVILRPVLVLGPQAYGGSAVLRAAAALPLLHLRIFPEARVQTVALSDLTAAVQLAVEGKIASGTAADLTEAEARSFDALVLQCRQWLGFPAPRWQIPLPRFLINLLGRLADGLGHLGWRSPLRSTALTTLSEGIAGDPKAWIAAGGTACQPLQDTLHAMPATLQDRWFARSYLLLPLVIATLALFWLLSGMVGLWSFAEARDVLTARGLDPGLARLAVATGILVDLTLGLLVLHRRTLRLACWGMIATSLGYLAFGSLLAPDLWADPLGPFVKVLPATLLAVLPLAWGDNR